LLVGKALAKAEASLRKAAHLGCCPQANVLLVLCRTKRLAIPLLSQACRRVCHLLDETLIGQRLGDTLPRSAKRASLRSLRTQLVHGDLLRTANVTHRAVDDFLIVWVHKLVDVWTHACPLRALQRGIVSICRLVKHVLPALPHWGLLRAHWGLLRHLWVCCARHLLSSPHAAGSRITCAATVKNVFNAGVSADAIPSLAIHIWTLVGVKNIPDHDRRYLARCDRHYHRRQMLSAPAVAVAALSAPMAAAFAP
jgi:hypothetical protein